ncbi:hypothetical protein [Sphingosinicella sp.]|uniref:hypothetical protein n=1 Tax=Sphingosinicella sp. TaxID=1917971 RepID=UPI0040380465
MPKPRDAGGDEGRARLAHLCEGALIALLSERAAAGPEDCRRLDGQIETYRDMLRRMRSTHQAPGPGLARRSCAASGRSLHARLVSSSGPGGSGPVGV